jgi:hypothetical protein
MRLATRYGLVVALVVVAVGHPVAQTATLSGDLLADWRQQKRMMMGTASAMPEETFDFKPTDPQRTYADLMQHLGGTAAAPAVDTTDFTVFGLTATSKADVLQALSDGYDYGIALLEEFSDEQLLETIAGPPYMGNATRVKMAYFALSHAMDIYGQMVVYLRLNDVTPPASRRGV